MRSPGTKVGAVVAVTCLVVVVAASAAGAPPASVGWKPSECRQVGRHGDTTYLLCFRSGTFGAHGTFIAKRGASERVVPVRNPGPTPTAAAAGKVGHWAWAALSPDGRTFLGQWSAECEVPIAFFVRVDGRGVQPVTRESDWAHSPTSVAYGWTTDGRAIVQLPRAPCGAADQEPGLYLISRAGKRTLVHPSVPVRRSIRARSASTLGGP